LEGIVYKTPVSLATRNNDNSPFPLRYPGLVWAEVGTPQIVCKTPIASFVPSCSGKSKRNLFQKDGDIVAA